MKHKRELEPEGTTSMRRECDRLSKAKHRALESESDSFLRKVICAQRNKRPEDTAPRGKTHRTGLV